MNAHRVLKQRHGTQTGVPELGGESGTDAQPRAYSGTCVEYVERTGHEAPGAHA